MINEGSSVQSTSPSPLHKSAQAGEVAFPLNVKAGAATNRSEASTARGTGRSMVVRGAAKP